MSRIRNCTVTAGVAAGLFLTAVVSSAAATADIAAPSPGLPGLLEQAIASSAAIPQQLLQTTASTLAGPSLAPPTAQTPGSIASATINLPPAPAATGPGAGNPASGSGLPGFPMPSNLSSVLPFPLPNLGGSAPVAAAPAAVAPGAFLPSAPVAVPVISGLP